ncbi:VanZ family protein [Natranaeroarchaeum sulfidigenes]|uniref:VanZ like family protein n=1 Tax=Natranaeroarchaeum sulfidigenes TaxID=2784880 RepID=A0A897ML77_9EURY|nr:VanZ family protein [Natranaeroarchaeum sulfidigenes]QSG01324.1 VanZ like family protein [Natranaeroarchaeum sulfidigenes]
MVRLPLVPRWLRWSAVVVAAAAIAAASLLVVPPDTPETGTIGFDKLWHAATYLGFGLLLAYALVEAGLSVRTKAMLVFGLATLYGVGIEIAQAFVPYRRYDVLDMVANAVGAALACGWYRFEGRIDFVGTEAFEGAD